MTGGLGWRPVPAGRLRRAGLLVATVLLAAAATACYRSVELPPPDLAAASSPAATSAVPPPTSGVPAAPVAGSTGLAEEPTHREVGLPASVAVVFIVGVAWGLVRVRRLAPVDERRKPSARGRTVGP